MKPTKKTRLDGKESLILTNPETGARISLSLSLSAYSEEEFSRLAKVLESLPLTLEGEGFERKERKPRS